MPAQCRQPSHERRTSRPRTLEEMAMVLVTAICYPPSEGSVEQQGYAPILSLTTQGPSTPRPPPRLPTPRSSFRQRTTRSCLPGLLDPSASAEHLARHTRSRRLRPFASHPGRPGGPSRPLPPPQTYPRPGFDRAHSRFRGHSSSRCNRPAARSRVDRRRRAPCQRLAAESARQRGRCSGGRGR